MNRSPILPRLAMALMLLAAASAQAAPSGPFDALDTNHDGAVSRPEFQAGYPGLVRALTMDLHLRDQFQALDADHSRAIDPAEYAHMALVQRAGRAAPALARFDANHDQKLDYAEYLAAVRTLAAPAKVTP